MSTWMGLDRIVANDSGGMAGQKLGGTKACTSGRVAAVAFPALSRLQLRTNSTEAHDNDEDFGEFVSCLSAPTR